jgi:hypothetical protein
MNVFCLDKDPKIAAQQHCDKHCVKMILECNQLLCTTFWMRDIEAPYRKTHYNHPCAIWARESRGNFEWLLKHTSALLMEYTKRYKKIHKSNQVFDWIVDNKHLLKFDKEEQTEFAVAISQNQKCRQLSDFDNLPVVEKYREYYNHDKSYMAKWQYSKTPDWYVPA